MRGRGRRVRSADRATGPGHWPAPRLAVAAGRPALGPAFAAPQAPARGRRRRHTHRPCPRHPAIRLRRCESRNCTRSACTRIFDRFSPVFLSSQVVHLQGAFDVDRAALLQVLAAVLGLPIPDRHVDEERFLTPLAVAARPRRGSSPSAARSPPCRWASAATPGRTSGDPSERLCSSRPSSRPPPRTRPCAQPRAPARRSTADSTRRRAAHAGEIGSRRIVDGCSPTGSYHIPAASTRVKIAKSARAGPGSGRRGSVASEMPRTRRVPMRTAAWPSGASGDRHRRGGGGGRIVDSSSPMPFSASTLGVEVIAWFTR